MEQVETFKYLGAIINNEGNLEGTINDRIDKTGKVINAIKTQFFSKKEMPKEREVMKKIG